MKSDALRGVVRVLVTGEDGVKFGTGIYVAPSTLLTSRHVVDPDEVSVVGHVVPPENVAIESSAFFGTRVANQLIVPKDPLVDLALVRFDQAKAVSRDFCCTLHQRPNELFSVGDLVDMLGFVSADSDIQMDTARVMGVHGRAGAYILNKAVPEGYSGGPVLVENVLVGTIYARNHSQGQSYFYGLGEAIDFIRENVPDSEWSNQSFHVLRRYPLGPAVSQAEIGMRLRNLIRECIIHYRGYAALEFIHAANGAREDCGPATGPNGLIQPNELTNPDADVVGFWHGAFALAGLKSPRLLAALLESFDDNRFTEVAKAERSAMLQRISSPNRR